MNEVAPPTGGGTGSRPRSASRRALLAGGAGAALAVGTAAVVPGTAAAIRGARLVTFETAGHGVYIDERDKFNRELLAFART